MLFLRQKHGRRARILLYRVEVKKAFREGLVDPAGAATFGHIFSGHVVVNLSLQFGWRNSPGFRGLMVSALEHGHGHSMFQGVVVSPQGVAAVAHVKVAPPLGGFSCSAPERLPARSWLWRKHRERLLREVLR